ncbi:MAG: hypothetical protein J6I84_02065 [Bacilli bacterium]|nr:hypothetical protein [Bacilli bacterium]
MKKILLLIPTLFIISACKTTPPPPIYAFGHDNGFGVTVTHFKDGNKFEVLLKKKQKYFSFSSFMVGAKETRFPELKEMFTFSDTGEETIKLNDEGYYAFVKALDERTISIKYDQSMRDEIVDSACTIYMTINSYTFTSKTLNSSTSY